MSIKDNEIAMWEAAKRQNSEDFLKLIDENAIMVCGGFRCSGYEYSQIINNFDIDAYKMTDFEIIYETNNICQIHYMIETKVACEENKDLEGLFHITSTWKKINDKWKLIFNMDSRIMGS